MIFTAVKLSEPNRNLASKLWLADARWTVPNNESSEMVMSTGNMGLNHYPEEGRQIGTAEVLLFLFGT